MSNRVVVNGLNIYFHVLQVLMMIDDISVLAIESVLVCDSNCQDDYLCNMMPGEQYDKHGEAHEHLGD
jgi:hypothetical protein